MAAAKKNTQQIILGILSKKAKPMTAYDILEKLKQYGISGPPTVYRALDALQTSGLVHRIESMNAFVACDQQEDEIHHSSFVLCKDCGDVKEIHDNKIEKLIKDYSDKLRFSVIQQTIELIGLCFDCKNQNKEFGL